MPRAALQMAQRGRLVLVLAMAALAVAACGVTRLAYMNVALAYSNATPVLAYMVGDYADLSDAQRDWVRERVVRALAWHRAEELPGYRRFFEQVLRQAEDSISVEEARDDYRELRERYYRLVERVIPDMADFLLQLDPQQAAQMERKFASDNRKMVSDSVEGTPEDRAGRRVQKYRDHIEEWTGRLSRSQQALIAESVAAMPEPVAERLADRRYRQAETLAIVRAKPPRADAIAGLRRILIDSESWRRPEYTEKLRDRDERLFAMIARLSETLSAGQRARFQKRVGGFMHDISELSASN